MRLSRTVMEIWRLKDNGVTTLTFSVNFGAEGSIWGIKLFFCVYSGCRDMLFDILSATISPHDFLLWYKNLSIEKALRGLRLG